MAEPARGVKHLLQALCSEPHAVLPPWVEGEEGHAVKVGPTWGLLQKTRGEPLSPQKWVWLCQTRLDSSWGMPVVLLLGEMPVRVFMESEGLTMPAACSVDRTAPSPSSFCCLLPTPPSLPSLLGEGWERTVAKPLLDSDCSLQCSPSKSKALLDSRLPVPRWQRGRGREQTPSVPGGSYSTCLD